MSRPKTLVEALRYAAGQDIELRFQDRPGRVTAYRYREVLERARRVAGALQERGIQPGDRVAERRLAHAVAADDGDDPVREVEVDPLQRVGLAVVHVQPPDAKRRRFFAPPSLAIRAGTMPDDAKCQGVCRPHNSLNCS